MRCVRVRSGRTTENPAFPDRRRRTDSTNLWSAGEKPGAPMRSWVLATAGRYTAVHRNHRDISAPLEPEGLEATSVCLRKEFTEPRIERLMDAMFLSGCRDERQVVNGLAEFRHHASRCNGYEANSNDGARSLQMVVVGSVAWHQRFCKRGNDRVAISRVNSPRRR